VDDDMYRTIVGVLVRTTNLPVDRLDPDARLDDLGLDSLAILEVGLALQKDVDGDIDDAEVAGARTVRDLVGIARRSVPSSGGR
jgi:acyl carrier protein